MSSARHTILGNFTQRPAFLAEVDDNATSAFLGFLYSLLNTEDQIRTACADIGAKDVASIALDACQHRGLHSMVCRSTNPTSSCMRNASLLSGLGMLAGSPKI